MVKKKGKTNLLYVISSCDEGLQLNQGIKIGFVGAGFGINQLDLILPALEDVLQQQLIVVSSQDDDLHIKHVPNVKKQRIFINEKFVFFAKKHNLLYAGHLDFKEPQNLKYEVRGHMVRPEGVHVAQNICFTLGGGEQIYSLANFVLSAEWISSVDFDLAFKIMKEQVDFIKKISFNKLNLIFQKDGLLSDELKMKNEKIIEKIIQKLS